MITPPQVPEELMGLVRLAEALGDSEAPQVFARNFRHMAAGQSQLVLDTGNVRLQLVTVPQNAAYVLTFISMRAFFFNVVGDREPWPFDEMDQRGWGTLRLRVNGAFIGRPEMNYLLLANHPCLFVFNPGDKVELIMNRSVNGANVTVGYPGTVNIASRMNGYLVTPAEIAQRFTGVGTQLITTPATVLQL